MEAEIPVRRHGTAGVDVVVLHGGPGAPGSAAGLARMLAAEFHVLEPWQRRSGPVPLTVARHVADLHRVAPRPALLVGHSWGAMLALSYAAAHPGEVSGLALVGCGTYDAASRAEYRRRMDARLGAEGRRRRDDLERRGRGAASRKLIRAAQAVDPLDDAVESDGEPVDEAGHRETWDDVLRLQATGVEPARFSAITVPVILLQGEDDPHPGAMIRDSLRPVLPQLEYVTLSRCGHEPWRERAARDEFRTVLTRWLRRVAAHRGGDPTQVAP